MDNIIKNRLDGLTVEQAYDLGRSDGRAEAQEASNTAEYDASKYEKECTCLDCHQNFSKASYYTFKQSCPHCLSTNVQIN